MFNKIYYMQNYEKNMAWSDCLINEKAFPVQFRQHFSNESAQDG